MLLVRYRRERLGRGCSRAFPFRMRKKTYTLVLDIALIGKIRLNNRNGLLRLTPAAVPRHLAGRIS
jgi:hypothetical protein